MTTVEIAHDMLKLRNMTRQLQQIIAGLPEGLTIVNPDQTIAWANEAALAMHGVKSLPGLGSTISD